MNIKDAQTLIAEADKVGHVVLLEGKHGLGKSAICSQYAKENNLHLEVLILSLMDTGDLIGLPTTHAIGGMLSTSWAAPVWYNRIVNAAWPEQLLVKELAFADKELHNNVLTLSDNTKHVSREQLNSAYCSYYDLPATSLQLLKQDKVKYTLSRRSMLFIDEMNRAATDTLNASLQLILDSRLNDHVLPVINGKPTCLVSAINPSDTSYTVSSFDPALLDRFIVAKLESSTTEWLDWARSANIHPIITSFIADNPNKLHFTPKDDTQKGSSNRSFARLSDYLHTLPNPQLANSHYVVGTLGNAVGAEFYIYLQNYSTVFTIKDVEKKVNRAPKLTDVIKLSSRLTKDIEAMEAIKRIDLAVTLEDKYIKSSSHTEALPYLAYLHALPVEALASYVSKLKSKEGLLTLLAGLDEAATAKELFHKLVNHT